MIKFWIIVTGYNCEQYVSKCYESLMKQTYKNFDFAFINDASTDGTLDECLKYGIETAVFTNKENMGAAFNRYHAIKQLPIEKEDVILLLGMDDELLPNCLERIKQEYDKGVYMTYGNWNNQSGKLCTVNLEFTDEEHEKRSYRSVQYRSTAPNTFKRFLFDELNEEDFKYKGEWLRTCTETHMMFSFLEMCGKEKMSAIKEPVYMYRENLPKNSITRFGREYKDEVLNNVINREKKQLL